MSGLKGHRLRVQRPPRLAGQRVQGFLAVCSCGKWAGVAKTHEAEAIQQHHGHIRGEEERLRKDRRLRRRRRAPSRAEPTPAHELPDGLR